MAKNSKRNLILLVEVLVVFLAGVGVMEREAVLIMTGLLVFYFIFSKIEDSLILFIISIPLFIALPITDTFDTMANWRILLAILFLVLLFKRGFSIIKFKHNIVEYLSIIFLGIGFLSVFIAFDPIAGIKKLLFLINIFLLYIIIRSVATNKEKIMRIIKAGAAAGIISLIIGYSQLISVLYVPLYTFWQWWTRNVISVFYGFDLSKVLSISNTWFSYYEDSPPTLRMFSTFPDSHSFALFTIIGLIFFSYLLISKTLKNKYINWGLWGAIILSFLALVNSGSRGIWLGAVVPFLAALFIWVFRREAKNVGNDVPNITRFFWVLLLIFVVAFPVSSLIMSSSQGGDDGALAFKRARSLADLEELSVKTRLEIWKNSFQSILKKPILGVGMGNYPIVLGEEISAAKRGASAHNLYLDVAAEMGLLGLIVLLLIFWQIFKKSWKTNLIFTFFLVWIFIYSLFDVVLLNDKVLLLFMVILGILYSYEKISISKHSNV